ncbi:MAG TPA: hypothetical protein VF771_00300 [Longimicrobiaceae bacterium]
MPRTRSRWTARIAAALVLLPALACTEVTIADPPAADSPLFEIEYRNFAWGAVWRGNYVDREGRLYSYDLGDSRDAELADSVLTPEQIARKYDHARALVKTLSADEVASRYERVAGAVNGPFTPERGMCADAGGQRFSAWIYRPEDGRYHRLLLHLRGDIAQSNRSPAAIDLVRWLESAIGDSGDHACDPFES